MSIRSRLKSRTFQLPQEILNSVQFQKQLFVSGSILSCRTSVIFMLLQCLSFVRFHQTSELDDPQLIIRDTVNKTQIKSVKFIRHKECD